MAASLSVGRRKCRHSQGPPRRVLLPPIFLVSGPEPSSRRTRAPSARRGIVRCAFCADVQIRTRGRGIDASLQRAGRGVVVGPAFVLEAPRTSRVRRLRLFRFVSGTATASNIKCTEHRRVGANYRSLLQQCPETSVSIESSFAPLSRRRLLAPHEFPALTRRGPEGPRASDARSVRSQARSSGARARNRSQDAVSVADPLGRRPAVDRFLSE
jgi:hypothetical protein